MDVFDLIERHEGRKLFCYDDKTGARLEAGDLPQGTPTIGVGHTGREVAPGLTCTDDQATAWKVADIALAAKRAAADLGLDAWSKLDEVREAALIDMAFEMGGAGLGEFHHMLSAVRAGDWKTAQGEALSSAWAQEVPDRARDDASMLLTGEWPAL